MQLKVFFTKSECKFRHAECKKCAWQLLSKTGDPIPNPLETSHYVIGFLLPYS